MLVLTAQQLREITAAVFEKIGAPSETATRVADSLVESNLVGHDSHGVARIVGYAKQVESGRIRPKSYPEIAVETANTALVDGNWGFGQVTALFAMNLAIRKARTERLSAVIVRRCNHVGRLGEYSALAAAQGMIGLVTTVGGRGQGTPYGGMARLLGTNPMSFAAPRAETPHFVLDFATTSVAAGKISVAKDKGEPVPEGWLMDKNGYPTTDPSALNDGGMLLPFGQHKGYGLNLMVDMLGGALALGQDFSTGQRGQGTFMLAMDIGSFFRPLSEFKEAAEWDFKQVKGVPPAPGFTEVLIPGEPELRAKEKRSRDGIPVPEATWGRILAYAREVGVDLEALGAPGR